MEAYNYTILNKIRNYELIFFIKMRVENILKKSMLVYKNTLIAYIIQCCNLGIICANIHVHVSCANLQINK